jgi:hypothetical protein
MMSRMGSKHTPEYQNFTGALKKVLQVSKAELQQRLEADKEAKAGLPKRGPKPKTSASGHVSCESD